MLLTAPAIDGMSFYMVATSKKGTMNQWTFGNWEDPCLPHVHTGLLSDHVQSRVKILVSVILVHDNMEDIIA